MHTVVSTVHNNNITILGNCDATWILETSFVFSEGAKRGHEFAVRVEDLHAVIVIVTHEYVVFVVARNAFRTIKQSILGTC